MFTIINSIATGIGYVFIAATGISVLVAFLAWNASAPVDDPDEDQYP